MTSDLSDFGEQFHRNALSDLRLGLDDKLSQLERGRIIRGSKQALWAIRLAEIHELYDGLVTQTVMGQMMDAQSRQLLRKCWLQISALERNFARVVGELEQQRKQNDMLLELLLTQKGIGAPLS